MLCRISTSLVAICALSFSGCSGGNDPDSTAKSAFESIQPEPSSRPERPKPQLLTADQMREALGANEYAQFERTGRKFTVALLTNSGATTLEPLRGQPLKVLDVSQTRITDLSPLEGMPLENLGLAETEIHDLSPLKGMPLQHIDATRSKVEDISVLAGMSQLSHLYLEGALVKDISPLKNVPLKVLWLNGCPIEDLSPLEGKHLEELNLCDAPLNDLSTVKTMKLGTLWMRNTNVQDLTPITEHGLVSLDIQGSSVSDLTPLSQMTSLKRLNIADTEVTDLSPLAGLELDRLILSPEKIQTGIDAVRNMPTLRAIDTTFEGASPQPMSPNEFWTRYDNGEWKSLPQP